MTPRSTDSADDRPNRREPRVPRPVQRRDDTVGVTEFAALPDTDRAARDRAHALSALTRAAAEHAAREYRLLAPLHLDDTSTEANLLVAAQNELIASVGLHTTNDRATRRIQDAHRAVTALPTTLSRLERGEITADQFSLLLHRTRHRSPEILRRGDDLLAEWDFTADPADLDHGMRRLAVYLRELERAVDKAPPPMRDARLLPPDPEHPGALSMIITGPAPTMIDMADRLDRTARAAQLQQKHALERGEDVPFDPDGIAALKQRPLSVSALRSILITSAEFTNDGLRIPEPRFQMFVQVPALTLLGKSDLPGTINGDHVIPADMARDLAGRSSTWLRILQDEATGAILPVPATRYRPTPQMLQHLRLRNRMCAAPGCTRRTNGARIEADHIVEFNHRDPHSGGRTEMENLHLLCTRHHQVKTAKAVDPVRIHGPKPGRSTGRTRWTIADRLVADRTDADDLIAASEYAFVRSAWAHHARRHGLDGSGGEDPPPTSGADPGPPPF